jgi:hypothetical protein
MMLYFPGLNLRGNFIITALPDPSPIFPLLMAVYGSQNALNVGKDYTVEMQ